jgi:hypothetical protein
VTFNDGTFTYDGSVAFADLDEGETGVDTFSCTISDGKGRPSLVTVAVAVAVPTESITQANRTTPDLSTADSGMLRRRSDRPQSRGCMVRPRVSR